MAAGSVNQKNGGHACCVRAVAARAVMRLTSLNVANLGGPPQQHLQRRSPQFVAHLIVDTHGRRAPER